MTRSGLAGRHLAASSAGVRRYQSYRELAGDSLTFERHIGASLDDFRDVRSSEPQSVADNAQRPPVPFDTR
jgi:hypothetical protein